MRPVFSEENVNLFDLATEIVRESFTAARRLKMYEPEHPVTASICERPFMLFKRWFHLRQSLVLVQDKNSVAASGLRLVKEVCNESTTSCTDTLIDVSSLAGNGNYGTANTARPNDVLRYRIIYTNAASGAVTNVVINDTTPPFTDYVASTCASTPAGLVCTPTTTPAVCVANASCAVRWALTGGALNAGAQGIVVYRVSVRP